MLERISAIIFNCREALGKLEVLRVEMSKVKCEREEAQSEKLAVSGKEIGEEELKELDQQTITIAERYIIFHDAIVKLEKMVEEVSSKK